MYSYCMPYAFVFSHCKFIRNANWSYIMAGLKMCISGCVSTCFQHQFTMAAYTVVGDNLIREIPA